MEKTMYEQAEEILLPKFNSIEDDVKQQCVEAMIEFSDKQNKKLIDNIETALRDGIEFGLGCCGICTNTKENNFVDKWLEKNKT